MALSKKFRTLMEDMRRPVPSNRSIDEDRDERVERREERRRERKEGRFSDPSVNAQDRQYGVESSASGKFKISAFIKALEGLKNQIIAKIIECDARIKTDQTGTGIVAQKYKQKYLSFLDRTASLLGEIYSRKEKEGRNLEGDEDAIIIKAFRDNYNSILTELEESSKSFTTDIDTKAAEYLKGLKFKEITAPLAEADKLFAAASMKIDELLQIINQQVNSAGSTGDQGSSSVSSITDTIKGGVKYANDSKEGKVVIDVKKSIYQKFKKYKSLSGSKDWGVVYKSYPNVSGTLLANTQAVIKGVKAGLASDYPELKSDTTGNITPAFVSILAKVNESASSMPGKLISYEDFLKGSKITEGFDETAATSAMSGKSSRGSGSGNVGGTKSKVTVPEYSATPFTTEEEGNAFRTWVNQKHADWAKSNNLSAVGPMNNNYIRKAYNEFGSEYKKTKEAPKVVKKEPLTNAQMDSILKTIEGYGTKGEIKFTISGKEPCIYYYKNKQHGFIYNTGKISYRTEGGKLFGGTFNMETKTVKFDNGKAFSFESVVKFLISDNLSSESAENAQGKKAYVGSTSGTKIYVTSTYKDLDSTANVILKYDTKDKYIGLVTSTTKRDGKTLYKVNFPEAIRPNKNGSNVFEDGWVRADSVNLK
jgi:hypothetical protein